MREARAGGAGQGKGLDCSSGTTEGAVRALRILGWAAGVGPVHSELRDRHRASHECRGTPHWDWGSAPQTSGRAARAGMEREANDLMPCPESQLSLCLVPQ